MPFEHNFTYIGGASSSTGRIAVHVGPTILHTINIHSSGTAGSTFTIYNATASSTGTAVAIIDTGTRQSFTYDIVLPTGLFIGDSSSTGEVTISWA